MLYERKLQEFTFDTNRDEVLTLFVGKEKSLTIDRDYGGEPTTVQLIGALLNTGNWGIAIFVEFKSPNMVISRNSRTLKIAMIELVQTERNKCHAIPRFLPDNVEVEHHLSGMRELAFEQGRDIVTSIWSNKIDEYLKQGALSAKTQPSKAQAGKPQKFLVRATRREFEQYVIQLARFHGNYKPTVLGNMIQLTENVNILPPSYSPDGEPMLTKIDVLINFSVFSETQNGLDIVAFCRYPKDAPNYQAILADIKNMWPDTNAAQPTTVQTSETPQATAAQAGKSQTRGRRGYGTRAEKRQAYLDWQNLDDDTRPRLEDWLETQFGENAGVLNVKPRTFQGWKRYV